MLKLHFLAFIYLIFRKLQFVLKKLRILHKSVDTNRV